MWLLNTRSYRLKEFFADKVPKYAILSHTWEPEGEFTFQDIQNLHEARRKAKWLKVINIQRKAGWLKIEKSCEYVRQYKFEWIWIDTCCIDKSSSAELSEALNSMFKYYKEAHVCIAYLSGYSMKSIGKEAIEKEVLWKDMMKSKDLSMRWFTRGWTLQELIAPHYMVFLDKDWHKIGTRFSLRHALSGVTSIPVEVFEKGSLDDYSIAQKMSWAASRETKREEDMAYCLMGLFGVNMPPIYGEGGAKAFLRLQQEIIRYSDDRSIFAWVSQDYRDRGMFASSPSEFASSGKVGISDSDGLGDKSSFSFGNNGLRIHLPLQHLPNSGENVSYASLHCRDPDGVIGIYLQKQGHRYIRWRPYFSLSRTDEPLGDNLQEVVVKEIGAVPRQFRKADGIPVTLKFGSDDVSLSSDYFFRKPDEPFLCDPFCDVRLCTKKGNKFYVNLFTAFGDVTPVLQMWFWDIDNDVCLLQDSGLLPVDDEKAFVSFFAHTTGDSSNQRIVEINYIPSSTAELQLHRQTHKFRSTSHALTSKSLTLNLTVVAETHLLSGPSVFPEFRWVGDREEANMSISYPGEQCDSVHCVLKYKRSSDIDVFIALGLLTDSEHHIPWVDVFGSPRTLSISDVWESYFSSGSRYGRRKLGTATTALEEKWSISVTVERKISLGSAWYHAVLNSHYYK